MKKVTLSLTIDDHNSHRAASVIQELVAAGIDVEIQHVNGGENSQCLGAEDPSAEIRKFLADEYGSPDAFMLAVGKALGWPSEDDNEKVTELALAHGCIGIREIDPVTKHLDSLWVICKLLTKINSGLGRDAFGETQTLTTH